VVVLLEVGLLEVDHLDYLDVLEVDLYTKDGLEVVLYSMVVVLLGHLEVDLFILLMDLLVERLEVVLYNRDGLVEDLFIHLVDLVLLVSELNFKLWLLVLLPSKLLQAPHLQLYWMKCYYKF
jgi:hypothetical protein